MQSVFFKELDYLHVYGQLEWLITVNIEKCQTDLELRIGVYKMKYIRSTLRLG